MRQSKLLNDICLFQEKISAKIGRSDLYQAAGTPPCRYIARELREEEGNGSRADAWLYGLEISEKTEDIQVI